MAQIEEFMFQNVAYRPTVYRTGLRGMIWHLFFGDLSKSEKLSKIKLPLKGPILVEEIQEVL